MFNAIVPGAVTTAIVASILAFTTMARANSTLETPKSSSGTLTDPLAQTTINETRSFFSMSLFAQIVLGLIFVINVSIGYNQFVQHDAEPLWETLGGYNLQGQPHTQKIKVFKIFIREALVNIFLGPIFTLIFSIYASLAFLYAACSSRFRSDTPALPAHHDSMNNNETSRPPISPRITTNVEASTSRSEAGLPIEANMGRTRTATGFDTHAVRDRRRH
ncbi:hypothetical protein QBC32DRAFT_50655 [Pseudoneurospora amorphoporcata]|uniref:Uncharacterized protein n=1 Tax=Pseudoneurospora amorphoporcata TaxID=241081 RepID=A0AAN6NRU5_9PEZI|nr:hypothetical protein QBC32DRAFT_50655 [Pseudoneurospora amorphoporcata]